MTSLDIAKALVEASEEVQKNLAEKAKTLDAIEHILLENLRTPSLALQHAVLQIQPLAAFMIKNNASDIAPKQKWENLIDRSLVEDLPFPSSEFEKFARDTGIVNPTFEILFDFRREMLERLNKILEQAQNELN
jgi:hypothetical protein